MIPVVFVHGFMGGRAQWALQQDEISASRELICVELQGFGDRQPAQAITSIKGFADQVIADLDAQGIGEFDLLGHSMGGMIVQQIAHQIPARVRRLVLFGTGAVGLLPGRFETIEQSKVRARTDGVPATARRIAATWFAETDKAQHYPACAAIAEKTQSDAFEGGLDAMAGWSGENWLGSISAPTLVLWGELDRTYPWEQTRLLWQAIPNARLHVLTECAHAAHMEDPEAVNHQLLEFLG